MQDFGQDGSSFDQVWGALKRRRWLALLLFVGAFALIASVIVALPDYYRASATILVNKDAMPESYVRSSVSEDIEPRLFAVTQEVTSRDHLVQLIEEEDLYSDDRRDASESSLVDRMRRDISIEQERAGSGWGRDTTVAFTLTYQGFERESAARVANRLAELYVGENDRMRARQASGTTEFLKAQLDTARGRLDEQERAVNSYRESRLGELPEQQSANLATLERLNAQLRMNSESQLRTMERRRELVQRMDEEGYSAADSGSERLSRLRRELADLRTRYSDRHPDVVRLRSQIEGLAEAPSAGGSFDVPGTLQRQIDALDEELEALRREESRLQRSTAVYEERIENVPRREQELGALNRDYNATREQYNELLENYEQALLAESLEARDTREFRIVEFASAPDAAAGPPRTRLLLMALVASLMFAGAGVVLLEHLDSSFHTIEELKGFTAVPVVAGIPRIITLGDVVRGWVRTGLSATAVLVLVSALGAAGYFIGLDNTGLVSLLTGKGT